MYPEQPQAAAAPPYNVGGPPPMATSPGMQVSGAPYPTSSYGYPVGAYTSGPPAGPGGPAQPPAQSRSWLAPALLAVAGLLVIAVIATAAIGFTRIGNLRQQANTLRQERDDQKKLDEANAAKLQSDFRNADLTTKYQRVKDLDKAVDGAFDQWDKGDAKFGVLGQAIEDCDAAVDEFVRAAAPFPATMFSTALPQKVDFANRETDCGRAFTNRI